MATVTQPMPARDEPRRPNLARADIQLPAVKDYEQVDREISGTLRPTLAWFLGLGVAVFFLLIGISAWMYQIYSGLGVAGYNPPVMWGVYIITFVFWIGIGHAGTLISAILYLFRAGFRTTIYRCAVPDPAPRPSLEILLADPVPELALHLAAVQESAGVGRVRDPHVFHHLEHLPLHRIDPGHRGAP